MGHDVVCLGDFVADIIVPIPRLPLRPNDHQIAHGLQLEPGGIGNFAIMAARLGLNAAVLDCVGDDLYSRHVRAALATEGVDVSALQLLTGKRSTVILNVSDDDARHVFVGALADVQLTEIPAEWATMIATARALFLNGYAFVEASRPEVVLEAMGIARRQGAEVCFDPGPFISMVGAGRILEAIGECSMLLLTHAEALQIAEGSSPEQLARQLLARGPRLVVVKLGAEGCLIVNDSGAQRLSAVEVLARDTSGAGDAFDAALLTGILHGLPLTQAGRLANAAGALTATRKGGGTQLPTRSEIEALL